MEQAKSSWARINNALGELEPFEGELSEAALVFQAEFDAALCDDLNTPEALAAAFDAVSTLNRSGDLSLGHAARGALEMLGFSFEAQSVGDELTPQLLELLIEVRNAARERRDFAESDRIRDRLKGLGLILEDGPDGTKWKRE